MLEKFDDWFCEGWRRFYTWWSIWLHTIGTALAAALLLVQSMPDEIQALIPVEYRAIAVAVWYIGGIVARIKAQSQKGSQHGASN